MRGLYREMLGDGRSGEAATDALLAEWSEVINDPEESSPFWLALADTQWRVGRLEDGSDRASESSRTRLTSPDSTTTPS